MKIAALSDLHGNFQIIPELFDSKIDLLLVGGDILSGSHLTQLAQFNQFITWVENINPRKCLFVWGNHDYLNPSINDGNNKVVCLHDTMTEFEGVHVYGSPWTPIFCNWNWMKEDSDLKQHWENIHPKTDILMTHGPAYGVCDVPLEDPSIGHVGSRSLRHELIKCNDIKYHFSGHIHSASHDLKSYYSHGMKSACVSLLNEKYRMTYKPLVIEI